MKVLYFDTSALVKLYIKEQGSAAAARLFDSPDGLVFVSEIVFLEFESALCKKVVREEVSESFAQEIREIANREAEAAIASGHLEVITLDSALIASASRWIGSVASESRRILTALDALHLGSALKLQRLRPVFVSSDQYLLAIADDLGLATIDPEQE